MYPTKNVNDSTQVNGEPKSVEVDGAMLGRALGDAFWSRLLRLQGAVGPVDVIVGSTQLRRLRRLPLACDDSAVPNAVDTDDYQCSFAGTDSWRSPSHSAPKYSRCTSRACLITSSAR